MKKVYLLLTICIFTLSCSGDNSNSVNQPNTTEEGNIIKIQSDYLDQRMLDIGFSESPDGSIVTLSNGVPPANGLYNQEIDLDEMMLRTNMVQNGNYLIIKHKNQGSLPDNCKITVRGHNVGGTHEFEYINKEIGDVRIALQITGLDN